MLAWIEITPATIWAVLISFVPGFPTAWAIRLRGLGLLAGSIAASFAIIALSSLLAPALGLQWSVIPVFALAVVVSAVALSIRRWVLVVDQARPRDDSFRFVGTDAMGWLIAGGLIAWILVRSIGEPGALSQNYDTPFHVNAVSYILEHGSASPFDMRLASHGDEPTFYPTLWHAAAAIVAQLSGASALVSTNVMAVVVSAAVWPLSVLFLVRSLFPGTPTATLLAGALIPTFATFPYRFLTWGLLYPNLLSTALLPIPIAFLILALRSGKDSLPFPRLTLWVAGLGALGAASLAHPNAVFSAAVFLIVPVLAVFVRSVRSGEPVSVRFWKLAGGVTTLITVVLLWKLVSTTDNERAYDVSFLQGLKEGLVTSPFVATDMWLIGALVASGAIIVWHRREHRWLIFAHVAVLALLAVAMGPSSSFRTMLTEAWYNDAHRLAALIPIAGIPLATVTLQWAWSYLAVLRSRAGDASYRLSRATAVALMLPILLVFLGQLLPLVRADISANFTLGEDSDFVTPDERELFEQIPALTPEDAVIASNPWNGSVYIYSLGERELLFPYLKGNFAPESYDFVDDFVEGRPEACEFMSEWGITHVVTSSHPNYLDRVNRFSGLDHVGNSPYLQEVKRIGGASLYTVTGCD